jgi:hypothetical protein
MLSPVFEWLAGYRLGARAGSAATIARRGACSALLFLALTTPAQAIPTIVTANGVTNPPSSLSTTALPFPQTAIPDTATLVPTTGLLGTLQAVLDAQGFSNANNWSLVANAVMLATNATFTLSQYNLVLNPGGNNQDGGLPIGTPAGSAFGETIRLALNPNLAGPANVPVGSAATIHWLQLLNEDRPYNGFGFPIAGSPGFWQFDNGDVSGGAAAGPATGPYYDSFALPGAFPVPPMFVDAPRFYSGVGSYLHFTVIPIWDVFTPATDGKAATESIDIADFGLAWGFFVVPEPSSLLLLVAGFLGLVVYAAGRRTQRT